MSGSCFEETSNCTNTTSPPPNQVDPAIVLTLQVNGIVGLTAIMVGMGCTLYYQDLLPHLKKPWKVLLGLFCQFFMMPLIGFGLIHAFDLSVGYAIGVLVISCSPGGAMSNIFTYWTDGDVALSIIMTTASTIFALGMMPLNLYIYSSSWTSTQAVIPYLNIVQSLAAIIVPVMFGIYIRHKSQRIAEIVIKICSILSALCILLFSIMTPFLSPQIFNAPWTLYFMAIFMPVMGGIMGYLLGVIFKIPAFQCRTVAFETGLQNTPLATTVITLSFSMNNISEYILYPIIYSLTMLLNGAICALVYRIWKKRKLVTAQRDEADEKANGIELKCHTIKNIEAI